MKLHREFDACNEGEDWLETMSGSRNAWHKCHRGDWMVWLLASAGIPTNRLVKLLTSYWYTALGTLPHDKARQPRLVLDTVITLVNLRDLYSGDVLLSNLQTPTLSLLNAYFGCPRTTTQGDGGWFGIKTLISLVGCGPDRDILTRTTLTSVEEAAVVYLRGAESLCHDDAMVLLAEEVRRQFDVEEVIRVVLATEEEFEAGRKKSEDPLMNLLLTQ